MTAQAATLTITTLTQSDPVTKKYVLDCRHGTTTSTLILPSSGIQLTDTDVARAMVDGHERAEGCTCTRNIRDRYGIH